MHIYREITPLQEPDVFVVLNSFNNGFNYPIHNHPEFELNLVSGISGERIVGDSTEHYFDNDLVLLGSNLYHKWDGDEALLHSGQPYRVITIQFGMDLFSSKLLQKDRFYKIRKLLQDASRGIKFHGKTFEAAKSKMVALTEDQGFTSVIGFLQLLDLLSQTTEMTFLASEGFTPQALRSDSNRIQIAYGYILKNFHDPDLKIGDLAALVNMSSSTFSHFFQKYTNKNFTEFLIDVRLGNVCKLLLNTDENISQISYRSGFNNSANFNRLFRKYRSCTPAEYRRRNKENGDFDWEKQMTPSQFLPNGAKVMADAGPFEYSTTKVVHA
ncbi:MAG: helix-turn-helix domain-containing protein [Saprospiraceae bacterium]|nr:helix-turn-helix domain-containing protein [Saprospiraceae bacterium]